jgi:hypothetical protein
MAARVQRRDTVRLATVTTLLRTEVGDEAGTVGRLGQAGREAKWVGQWWRVLLGTLPQQGDDFS